MVKQPRLKPIYSSQEWERAQIDLVDMRIIKLCYKCDAVFTKCSEDSYLWICCEKCDNWCCKNFNDGHVLSEEYLCTTCKPLDLLFAPSKTSSPNPPETTELRR